MKKNKKWLFSQNWWIRPNPDFYIGKERKGGYFLQKLNLPHEIFEERQRALDNWENYPSATSKWIDLEIENIENEISFWIDGRYLTCWRPPKKITQFRLELSSGNEISSISFASVKENQQFLPLNISYYGRAGSIKIINTSLKGKTIINNIPFIISPPEKEIDVGLSRWLEEKIDPASFCDKYTTRSAFDGNPESIILSIPKRFYSYAYILCFSELDENKVPVISLRLTRFGNNYGDNGGRGDAFADSTVFLNKEKVKEVGKAEIEKNGKKIEVPIYLVKVKLNLGYASDLLSEELPKFGREGEYLDLEITKELRVANHFGSWRNCSIKPLGFSSSVHILGITLEKSPVEFKILSGQPGNIFYSNEKPFLKLNLKNISGKKKTIKIIWESEDYYGKKKKGIFPVIFLNPEQQKSINFNLTQFKKLGWYKVTFKIYDENGILIWEEPTRFALLPPDTRKAGNESPFGIWWFQETHGGTEDINIIGPILQKMGYRHISPFGKQPESELLKYKITRSMINSRGVIDVPNYQEKIKKFIDENPNVKIAMVFHEHHIPRKIGYFPELLEEPVEPLSPEGKKVLNNYWEITERACKFYRQNYPNIKISFGNSSSSLSVEFMRAKFPKELIDMFGLESIGSWKMPERQPEFGGLQEAWWIKKIKEIYGYEDIPISSGFEYIYRPTDVRSLTEKEQAEYYTRDILHCLAYGFPSINVGLLYDVADSYYYTVWGCTGVLKRYPLLTPKPSYVSIATLTSVLDCAKYKGYFDTGSTSLYCLKFWKEGENVYPFWTLRGKRVFNIEFEKNTSFKIVDSMGNEIEYRTKKRKYKIIAETSPSYIISSVEIVKVEAGESIFESKPSGKKYIIDSFETSNNWEVINSRDIELETNEFDVPRRLGKFNINSVVDKEKGKCLEITLLPQPEIPEVCPRYLVLKMKNPVEIPGKPKKVGIWVKGNSSWGRVIWEFFDAKGERWIFLGEEPERWNVCDWKAETYINFDGWNYISFEFPERYPGGYHGIKDRNWKFENGDGIMDFPIKPSRLIVELRDKVVYLTDIVSVKNPSIRIKDFLMEYFK